MDLGNFLEVLLIERYNNGEEIMRLARTLITFLLLIFIGFGATAQAAIKKQKAIVKFVTGEVLYQKKSKGKWKKVKVGSKISEKDMVRTFVESSAQLLLASGSQITVEENTIVKMAELVQDGNASSTNINVKKGRVLFNIKKLAQRKSKFKFETLTATAAIRGTKGGIGFTGKRAFAYLSEGKLDLLSRSGKKVAIKAKDFVIQSDKGFEIKKLENKDDLKKFLKELIEEAKNIDITKIDPTVSDSIVIDSLDTDTVAVDTLGAVEDSVETVVELSGVINSTPPQVLVPQLPVTGTCSGTEVSIGGQNVPVSNGTWQASLSWSESDKGEKSFEASCSDGTTSIIIGQFTVMYGVELSLNLQTSDAVDVKNGVLNIRGSYTGSPKTQLLVSADGKVTDISSKSQYFSFVLPINDRVGTWNLDEVTLTLKDVGESDIVQKISVAPDKTSKAVNTMPPKLSAQPNVSTGEAIIIVSQAKDDEVSYSIKSDDGTVEEETDKDVRYIYALTPGKHDYEVVATDLAGNEARLNFNGIEYWPSVVFNIDIEGSRSGVIRLPPRLPKRQGRTERHPTETLEFEITGLPNDDSGYIKRITVKNSALSRTSAIFENNTIESDNRYRVDVELVRKAVNKIEVRVEPVKGRPKTAYKSIQIK